MLEVRNLRIEYLDNPCGIDTLEPRLSYVLEGDSQRQTASLVECAADEGFTVLIGSTGKVVSATMTGLPLPVGKLESRQHVHVRAKVWDDSDVESPWSRTANFEMGLLNPEDWKAKWISGDYKPRKNMRYPVDCFLRTFPVEKRIAKARLYITACGLYEAKINGVRVGTFVFGPGCTDYRHHIQYQTYDVSDLLREQENRLEVELADGWYRGSLAAYGVTNVFGRQTKLLAQLEIAYEDGSAETIGTDERFRWSDDGSGRFADMKDGEVCDAAMKPSYGGQAKVVTEIVVPTASNNVAICEKEHFTPNILFTPSGKLVLDFGQNLAGILALRVKGRKGQTLRVRLGETLDENGEFTQMNFQERKPANEFGNLRLFLMLMGIRSGPLMGKMAPSPKQEVHFTCSGGEDTYRMRFSVAGFRYAELETDSGIKVGPGFQNDPGTDADSRFQTDSRIKADSAIQVEAEAIAVYSDMDQTGDFSCSHPLVNQLVKNTRWSMKGNFLDVPTDCPTRERLGWTGDAQIFLETGAYLMNIIPFYRKWLKDMRADQYANGQISATVPYAGAELMYKATGTSAGWADAAILLPYRLWKRYGDLRILTENYPMMKRMAEYLMANTGMQDAKAARANPYNRYTYEKGVHLGEWLEPRDFREAKYGAGMRHPEECTAYLHHSMTLMAEVAEMLGEPQKAAQYREVADGAKKAYAWLFFKDACIDTIGRRNWFGRWPWVLLAKTGGKNCRTDL